MTCKLRYDVKSVAYEVVDSANFLNPIGSNFQQLLVFAGVTIDTKAENVEYSILNSTKHVDSTMEELRKIGSLKIEKNLDSSFMTNHKELLEAGLGTLSSTAKGNVVVTAGKGSVSVPFLTTSTTNLAVNNIVYIPEVGLRKVLSIVANTSFVVDIPLDVTISTSTTFVSFISCDVALPKGLCTKSFNVVVTLADGNVIEFLGAVPQFNLKMVYEKQPTVEITFTSPEVVEVAVTPVSVLTSETKGTPIKVNFSSVKITDEDDTLYSYFPMNFDLGLTQTVEKEPAIGGRNNVVGYRITPSIKPKMTLDRIAKVLTWVNNPTKARNFQCYQSNFCVYAENITFYSIDRSINTSNSESITVECNANNISDKTVYLVLPQ